MICQESLKYSGVTVLTTTRGQHLTLNVMEKTNSLKQITIYGSYCYLMQSVLNHEYDCGSKPHPISRMRLSDILSVNLKKS